MKKRLLVANQHVVLGELIITNMDFPWVLGSFVAYAEFEKYKELFALEIYLTTEIDDIEERLDHGIDSLEEELERLESAKEKVESETQSLNLVSLDPESNEEVRILTIHIDKDKFDYR
ncbi:hypothetical protein OLMES_1334 [Oleiphilus messinensis]|uniref:Uncharacterized protein n=1 Tax=Oleiphilus messinensis TaxID=141451 RepID=A0A1Y0I4L5_9GAMM|nr:hypothetical protein [Oleiphilus messinensis]ARU55412.1 hypothetical protein OLMES_1334 [Oleiphilus messinensis]